MKRLLWSELLLLAGAALAESPHTPPAHVGFPVSPPIADADPADRHPITISMPTKLQIDRDGDVLTVTPISFQEFKVLVGKNMATGVAVEKRIHQGTESRDLGMQMQSGLPWKPSAEVLSHQLDTLRKGAYSLEYTITVFETDLPPQHIWSPRSGKAYKALWTRTFKEWVK